jgi:hypothetical protein
MVQIFKEYATFIQESFTQNLKQKYGNHEKSLSYLMSNLTAIQKEVHIKSGRK